MGTVQRLPGGLLELLGAKTSGYTLEGLRNEIAPSLDMLALMGLSQPLICEKVSNAALAEGGAVTLTVPASEWWLLYAASVQYTSTTTATFRTSIRISATATNTGDVVALASHEAGNPFAATFVAGAIFVPPMPWLLPPGTILWGVLDLLGTDATAAVSMNARVAKLT